MLIFDSLTKITKNIYFDLPIFYDPLTVGILYEKFTRNIMDKLMWLLNLQNSTSSFKFTANLIAACKAFGHKTFKQLVDDNSCRNIKIF